MEPGDVDVVVVGAGISGLALGFGLARLGARAVVLEAAERAGGHIRTTAEAGFRVEWGPNGFLDDEPAMLRLVEAVGLGASLVPAREEEARRWVVRDGRLRELPRSPPGFLASDVLSLPGRLRVLLEWTRPRRRDGAADETVAAFAERRLGREAADVLADALVTGIYAGDASRLSVAAAFPRLAGMERRHGSLLRAQLAMRREARAAAAGPLRPGRLTSLAGGMEELVRALATRLGPRLQTGVGAVRLRAAGAAGWSVETAGAGAWRAPRVVLACPARAAAGIVRELDAELAGELAAIPVAPVAVVALAWREADLEAVPRGFGFLVPARERLPVLGVLHESWVFPGRAPAGRALWRTMIGGARDPDAAGEPDAALAGRAREACRRLLGIGAEPERTWVIRHPRGIAQYEVGHGARLARIDARLARLAGVAVAGSSYRGVALGACVREAEALSAELAASAPR